MNKTKYLIGGITFAFCGVLLASLTGCLGVEGTAYVGGPGYVETYVPAPEVVVFGGYGRGGFDRDAGRRGAASRAVISHAAPSRSRGPARR